MTGVGFEPTPPKRLVPKTSALDHSATLPPLLSGQVKCYMYIPFGLASVRVENRDSHPGLCGAIG